MKAIVTINQKGVNTMVINNATAARMKVIAVGKTSCGLLNNLIREGSNILSLCSK